MSNRKKRRERIDNSLTQLAAGIQLASFLTGGSTLSSYGTIGFSNNYSLITYNRIMLTYLYCGNGIIQTAIDLPVQDAISRGIEIESGEMDAKDSETILEWWDDMDLWNIVLDATTWARLYGGGGIIINSNQDPESPLDIQGLKRSPIEFYDVDRWQIDVTGSPGRRGYNFEYDQPETYYFQGQKIHNSRVIRINGKRAPSYIRRNLRGWGLSEIERMIRDINLYLKTQDVLYEILDESKIDIYKIKNLANSLATTGGAAKIQNRVMLANQIKNYVNALILDSEEDFEQKTLSFSGLAEVMKENRIGIAAALRMPVTKLFGLSASGFNTGESDLENYNSMVESQIRRPMKRIISQLLDIGMIKKFGYIPSYKINFPPLRVLSAIEEEQKKTSHQNRILQLYDRGLMESEEVGSAASKGGLLEIKTKAEKGFLPPQPQPPAGGEFGAVPEQNQEPPAV